MISILESVLQGMFEWLWALFLEMVQYLCEGILSVFSMDLAFFDKQIPIASNIYDIIIAVGWALLLGNLVFQALKVMMAGIGFDGEDPKLLFTRTFVFAFLLLAARPICNIGLGITNEIVTLLQVPNAVNVNIPEANVFPIGSSWLFTIIVGIILLVQLVKLFFEIGERYVILAILTYLSPLAFAMGGSQNTKDIFFGWVRMFASMCLMMVFNILFLKLFLSAMSVMPKDGTIIAWIILLVALARVARKIDGLIAKIGLNPALTGDSLSHSHLPGMLTMLVAKSMAKNVSSTIAANKAQTPNGATVAGKAFSGATAAAKGNAAQNNTKQTNQQASGQYATSQQSGANVSTNNAVNMQAKNQQSSVNANNQPGKTNNTPGKQGLSAQNNTTKSGPAVQSQPSSTRLSQQGNPSQQAGNNMGPSRSATQPLSQSGKMQPGKAAMPPVQTGQQPIRQQSGQTAQLPMQPTGTLGTTDKLLSQNPTQESAKMPVQKEQAASKNKQLQSRPYGNSLPTVAAGSGQSQGQQRGLQNQQQTKPGDNNQATSNHQSTYGGGTILSPHSNMINQVQNSQSSSNRQNISPHSEIKGKNTPSTITKQSPAGTGTKPATGPPAKPNTGQSKIHNGTGISKGQNNAGSSLTKKSPAKDAPKSKNGIPNKTNQPGKSMQNKQDKKTPNKQNQNNNFLNQKQQQKAVDNKITSTKINDSGLGRITHQDRLSKVRPDTTDPFTEQITTPDNDNLDWNPENKETDKRGDA